MNRLPRSWWIVGGAACLVVILDVTRRVFGLPVVLLLGAGFLLVEVIVLMWNSVQALGGEDAMTLEEALTLAAPAAEEEQKRAVLRALKDLEFERRVGKVSEEDYAALADRYRAEARVLLRQLDARYEPLRERIAAELESALCVGAVEHSAGAEGAAFAESTLQPAQLAQPRTKRGKASRKRGGKSAAPSRGPVPTRVCSHCGARSGLTLRECQHCGKALAAAGERLCSACPSRYESSIGVCPNCGVPAEDA